MYKQVLSGVTSLFEILGSSTRCTDVPSPREGGWGASTGRPGVISVMCPIRAQIGGSCISVRHLPPSMVFNGLTFV